MNIVTTATMFFAILSHGVLLAALITGCGAEAYQAPVAAAPKTAQADPVQVAPVQTDSPTEAKATPSSRRPALAVVAVADLPLCNANDEGWIIYVQAEKSLQACLGGDWQPVDVRGDIGVKGDTGAAGKDGADGKDGAKGDTGVAGVDGKDGVKGDTGAAGIQGVKGDSGAQGVAGVKGDIGAQGVQGIQGEPGLGSIPGPGVYWTDPDTLEIWLIVSSKTVFGGASCPAGFTLPTYVEQPPMKFHDYFSAYEATLPNGVRFWTSTLNGGRWVQTLQSYSASVESNGAAQHLFICHN